jgi:hypothetical protein
MGRAEREGGSGQSCNTILNSELLIFSEKSPAYSMKPSFWNLFSVVFRTSRRPGRPSLLDGHCIGPAGHSRL